MNVELTDVIIAIISGIAVCIPLAIKLIAYVEQSAKSKNWPQLLKLLISLMEQAEEKFEQGADKKDWVLGMIEASAKNINFDIDINAISKMIDSICSMTKHVNVK